MVTLHILCNAPRLFPGQALQPLPTPTAAVLGDTSAAPVESQPFTGDTKGKEKSLYSSRALWHCYSESEQGHHMPEKETKSTKQKAV